jgi:hypothetical protein
MLRSLAVPQPMGNVPFPAACNLHRLLVEGVGTTHPKLPMLYITLREAVHLAFLDPVCPGIAPSTVTIATVPSLRETP